MERTATIGRNPNAQENAPAMYKAYFGGMAFMGRTWYDVYEKLAKYKVIGFYTEGAIVY